MQQPLSTTPFLPGQDDKYKLPRAGHGGSDELVAEVGIDTSRELKWVILGRRAIPRTGTSGELRYEVQAC